MSVQVVGLIKVTRNFEATAKRVVPETDKTFMKMIAHTVPNVQKHTPVFKGTLKSNIVGQIKTPGKLAIVDGGKTKPVVVASVEHGAKPHWPPWGPGSALAAWANAKGIHPFLVARAISRKGTIKRFGYKGAAMFARGFRDSKALYEREIKALGMRLIKWQ